MEQPNTSKETLRENIVRMAIDRAVKSDDSKELLSKHVDAVETQGSLQTLLDESKALEKVRKSLKKEDHQYTDKQKAIKYTEQAINTRLRYKVLDSLVNSTNFLVVGNNEEEKKADLAKKRNEARGIFHNQMVKAANLKNDQLAEEENKEIQATGLYHKRDTVRVIDMYREKAKELLESSQSIKKVDLTAKAKHIRQRVGLAVGAAVLALTTLGLAPQPVDSAPTPTPFLPSPGPTPDSQSDPSKRTSLPTGTPTATPTLTETPMPEATIQTTETLGTTAELPEGLVNPDMHVGSINLEKDFNIILPAELAELIDMGGEGDRTFSIQSAPVSVDKSPDPIIHKEIPQDIQDMFDVKNVHEYGNVGAILRTNDPENNMVWAHDGTVDGNPLPLEFVKQLWKVYKENPNAVRGKYIYIQSKEDPTKQVKMKIAEMNEFNVDQMRDAMAFQPRDDSPVLFRTDPEGGLGLLEESRQSNTLHLTTCSGSIDFNSPDVASARVVMSTVMEEE